MQTFAYTDYSIGGTTYRVFSSTEQGTAPVGTQGIYLQPGQTFNQNTADIIEAELPTGTGNPSAAATNPGATASGASATGVGDLAQQSIATLGTCSIGAILGKLLSSLIGSLINTLTGFIANTAIEAAMQVVDCATHFAQVCIYSPNQANQTGKLVQKTVGGSVPAPSGLLGSYIPTPSLDSIMFCIVNEILTYITQATINWINSGFNGNPVFVQNPGALLQTVADQEANSFIRSLSGGLNQSTGGALGVSQNGGIQVYPGVADSVVRGLVNGYTSNINQFAAQRPVYLPQNATGLNSYLNGRSYINQPTRMLMEAPGYSSWYQQQVYASYMQQQIAQAQQNQTMRYQAYRGLVAPTDCPEYYRRADGTCISNGIMDTQSGTLIGGTLQNRDMMPYLRVSLAKDFDSIITALVNKLISIAVTDISKKTGISPTTIYSTGLGITNQALNNRAVPSAIPVYPQERDANGNLIPKATPVN